MNPWLRRLLGKQTEGDSFHWKADPEGLNFIYPAPLVNLTRVDAPELARLQLVTLRMLEEQELAYEIANGFSVSSSAVVRLDAQERAILQVPPAFPGSFRLTAQKRTTDADFCADVVVVNDQGQPIAGWVRSGPVLRLSAKEQYLLSPNELHALEALETHMAIPVGQRREDDNLRFILSLQEAAQDAAGCGRPMAIDLSHFRDLSVTAPKAVALSAEEQPDGSLLLTPNYGTGAAPEQIRSRLGQVRGRRDTASLRIGSEIVLLDEKRLEATQEILSNQHIPKEQVAAFLQAPSAFLNAALVDLDTGFSIRVQGVGRFEHIQVGETDASGIDWFRDISGMLPPEQVGKLIVTPEDLVAFKEQMTNAVAQGAQSMSFGGSSIDLGAPEALSRKLMEIEEAWRNQKAEPEPEQSEPPDQAEQAAEVTSAVLLSEVDDQGDRLRAALNALPDPERPDYSRYLRQPYPHQDEGVRWLLRLAESALSGEGSAAAGPEGALLADDMGLGKTYMALVGIGELQRRLKARGTLFRPVLIVAPLSLIENWEAELESTFPSNPFNDVVVLQSDRHLSRFRIKGAKKETQQQLEDGEIADHTRIRYALKVGREFGADRLDLPDRLVLATYQTLRDYQFSLCRVDWSIVVFDEAQNIKSPNTLQAVAAKGLKAGFKLLATGTPVENSLLDFHTLMDTAQPGLLGEWKDFRERYVRPINAADEAEREAVREQVGKQLRADVGDFMLRRLKEDHLDGLPAKRLFSGATSPAPPVHHLPDLAALMAGEQLARYDRVIESYVARKEPSQGAALAALNELRTISLHPDLGGNEQALISRSAREAVEKMNRSGKLRALLPLLNEIKKRDEKVIVFLMTKALQRLLKIWLEQTFGVPIHIINGDTAAVAKKPDAQTRRSLIQDFESGRGFGILIMSPIAAGVGLTVVEANNVIHLERHWNPAKEAQATDRVYRIGQKREVNIYFPLAHHPHQASFDANLDRLLARKTNLKDAVVTPQAVTESDLEGCLGQSAAISPS